MKKTAIIVCPGRGTYNKTELGYLHKFHKDQTDLFNLMDNSRAFHNSKTLWDIDGAKSFTANDFYPGNVAAPLIFASTYADFKSIDYEAIDVVAITGNSMGWYSALALAEVLSIQDAVKLISSMGAQLGAGRIGGQIIYPIINKEWHRDEERLLVLKNAMKKVNEEQMCVFDSIYFGGYLVIGGTENGINKLITLLPKIDDIYPLKLPEHSAFHTPLLSELSKKARESFSSDIFSSPQIPLIDGRGKIWKPYSSSLYDLWDYTLGHQIHQPYDFSTAIEVCFKEFAPDYFILAGPGIAMGGAVAQVFIEKIPTFFSSKVEFKNYQESHPFLIAMGDPVQRKIVIAK